MITENKTNDRKEKMELDLTLYYKFQMIKRLNVNIINFLENVKMQEISLELLEETEYYFDEMIHEYNEIKPLMKKLRLINYENNTNN
jgi:hypothetical protein